MLPFANVSLILSAQRIFFKSCGEHTCSFLGLLVPLFWIAGGISSRFQSQSGFCLIRIAEVNVMYIP